MMFRKRLIPCLLLKNRNLYKTKRFGKKPTYIGDPINAIKIFNDKEADELIVLDIERTICKQEPDFDYLKQLTGEAFMPMGYGGGVNKLEHFTILFNIGFEKVIVNTSLFFKPELIAEASKKFGAQSIVGSMDVKYDLFNKPQVYLFSGTKKTKIDPIEYAINAEKLGIGELFVNSIDRDGTMSGYDISFIEKLCSKVEIPVIASGGARALEDCAKAINAGASAAAAGSIFVYQGKLNGVLITYPSNEEILQHFDTLRRS